MFSQLVTAGIEQNVESNNTGSVFERIVDIFNSMAGTLQNILWTSGVLILVFIIILAVFSVQRRAGRYTEKQLSALKSNGKYIPGLFVELNESKEVLRYFLRGKKWRNRIISKYNAIYNNFYGRILFLYYFFEY